MREVQLESLKPLQTRSERPVSSSLIDNSDGSHKPKKKKKTHQSSSLINKTQFTKGHKQMWKNHNETAEVHL